MTKGVIFDLDGVLCFTDKLHFAAWKQAVEPLGIAFDWQTNHLLRGVSREQSLQIILDKFSVSLDENSKEEICRIKNDIYRNLLADLSPKDIDGDVFAALDGLKKRNIKLAVGSSSKNALLILQRTKLAEHFDAVVDGNAITHSKPHPEVYLAAAKALGLPPCDCMVVEDAEAGIDAGNAGGFVTVGIGPAADYSASCKTIGKLSDILALV